RTSRAKNGVRAAANVEHAEGGGAMNLVRAARPGWIGNGDVARAVIDETARVLEVKERLIGAAEVHRARGYVDAHAVGYLIARAPAQGAAVDQNVVNYFARHAVADDGVNSRGFVQCQSAGTDRGQAAVSVGCAAGKGHCATCSLVQGDA